MSTNEFEINGLELGTGTLPVTLAQEDIVIAGLWISNANYRVYSIDDDVITNVNAYDIPQNHGRGFLSNFKRGREIKFWIWVSWSSVSDFRTKLDALRKACYTPNAVLDMRVNGKIRRIKVNCTAAPNVWKHYNINFLKLEISFSSLESFWYELDTQATTSWNQTANFRLGVDNQGSAPSIPLIYVFFTAGASVTSVSVTANGYTITITWTFVSGDILRIGWGEGSTKKVYKNEVLVDYDGIFPTLEAGQNFFDFAFVWTFAGSALVLNKVQYV